MLHLVCTHTQVSRDSYSSSLFLMLNHIMSSSKCFFYVKTLFKLRHVFSMLFRGIYPVTTLLAGCIFSALKPQ